MNQDIWAYAVDHFFQLAQQGRWIDGIVGWTLGDGVTFHNAQGRLAPYADDNVINLSGDLTQQVPAYPGVSQRMELKIELPRGGRTMVTVTNTDSPRQVQTDDAFAAYPWFHNTGIAWIFQNWPEQDYVDVWLSDHFANLITQPISSAVDGWLGITGH
jgi:hypothetical protein